jgi:CDP-diacylglycerol--glycerol-3-phosphate 3-phosphatidyltransferase
MYTLTQTIGRGASYITDAILRVLVLSRIHPNILTFIGLLINAGAAVAFGYGKFLLGGLIVLGASLFDFLDGQVARQTKRTSPFGAFFDSVMDRYSDLALYFGLLVFYARLNRFFYVVLVALAMTGSVMVSYTRARAESLIGSCKVGFMERAERIVLIIIGALFDRMAAVLWVIAVLANITVVHRIIYTWQVARKAAAEAGAPASAAD